MKKTGNKFLDIISEAQEESLKQEENSLKKDNPQTEEAENGAPASTAGKKDILPENKENKEEEENKDISTKPAKSDGTFTADKVKAPASFNEEQRKTFSALPPDGQKIIADIYHSMNADYSRKTMQTAQARREIEEALKPIDGFFNNIQEVGEYVSSMVQFEREFAKNPIRTLRIMAENAGVSMDQLVNFQPNPMEEAIAPLKAQIEALRSQLSAHQPAQTRNFRENEGNYDAELEQLANAKDENGNLKFPHFKELAPYMGMIMRRDGHEDIQKAYEEALYYLPATREEVLKSQKDKLTAELAKAAELKKAKKAAALQMPSPDYDAVAPAKKGSLLDLIAETEKELSGN